MADVKNLLGIRTTEDLINAVSTLYFNLNELERTYYDVFINTTPMDVEIQRYNNTGVLETITIPNRAKDSQSAFTGVGSPEGVIAAGRGAHYLDTASNNMYYKCSGSDAYGWVLVWTALNLVLGTSILSPTGDASQLTNLNMNNAGSGILAVGRGGTGTDEITGLVKGNGSSAFTAAIDGTDFIGPSSLAGIIAYYPMYYNSGKNLPSGWLPCDGSEYSRTTYSRLFNALKQYDDEGEYTLPYGDGDGSTTFNVPNLMTDPADTTNRNSCFIRCWDGSTAFNTKQYDSVAKHIHELNCTTDNEDAHTHERGTMNITGSTYGEGGSTGSAGIYTGAFYLDTAGAKNFGGSGSTDSDNYRTRFDASKSWVGSTTGGSAHHHTLSGNTAYNNGTDETRVLNKMLVPIIKY